MKSTKTIFFGKLRGLVGILLALCWAVPAYTAAPPPTPEQIEADWLRQDEVRGLRGEAMQRVVARGLRLAASLRSLGATVDTEAKALVQAGDRWKALPSDASDQTRRKVYFEARWAVRKMALANPLLDFPGLLFATSAPGRWSHMADQYLGWWSQPGGGLYVLEDFRADGKTSPPSRIPGPGQSGSEASKQPLRSDRPKLRPLIAGLPPGNVLRPELDFEAKKVLFAWCRYYPGLSEQPDKLDKAKLPEDSFYHLFEANLDGTGLRQLTHGKYNDFDGRYLPDGHIVFCSTRRGQALQCTQATAAATLKHDALPECYVPLRRRSQPALRGLHAAYHGFQRRQPAADLRFRDVRVDPQHRRSRQNSLFPLGLCRPLWPERDGAVVHASRRHRCPRLFGNYSRNPECIFEARTVPASPRLICTASAHHSITAGSLVLLDPRVGPDTPEALTRLTPEVPFPESEGIPKTYYANPYPLSEDFYLVAWSDRPLKGESFGGANDIAAFGVYLYNVFGNLELLYRDAAIGSQYPLAIRPRRRPPQVSDQVAWNGPQEAQMLLLDVYKGLDSVPKGTIKRLRVVGMPVKTHPSMNSPAIGLTTHDSGRFVLGTVPVEEDGSALFRVPSGITLFVQALDAQGMAVQTMRSGTYLQPGQTYACIGCHEHRTTAPPHHAPRAAARGPSKLTPGPEGSWPLDYATLVQGLLDRQCLACHQPGTKGEKFDLTPGIPTRR